MQGMAARIQGMTDAKLGAWWRKAVIDCCSGCIDPKTDPYIKTQYGIAADRMSETQEHNARMYQNRKNRNSAEAPTREDGDGHHYTGNGALRESGSSANHYGDAAIREEAEVCLNRESGAVAPTTISNETEARQNLPAGELLKRVENGQSDSHCADNSPAGPAGLFPEDTAKKPYGTCKHVMLTDAEGHHLRDVYGQDLALAIEILDAYLENNPKALKKYKNHAAVLRKGNWVWKEVQENKINATRLENATKNNKSFKQQDLDARTEFFSKSIFEKVTV
jgi:hypothetical protein